MVTRYIFCHPQNEQAKQSNLLCYGRQRDVIVRICARNQTLGPFICNQYLKCSHFMPVFFLVVLRVCLCWRTYRMLCLPYSVRSPETAWSTRFTEKNIQKCTVYLCRRFVTTENVPTHLSRMSQLGHEVCWTSRGSKQCYNEEQKKRGARNVTSSLHKLVKINTYIDI